MKSTELRFEFNFLLNTKENPEKLQELYELADKLELANEQIKQLGEGAGLLSIDTLVEKYSDALTSLDRAQILVDDLTSQLAQAKEQVKVVKEYLKELEQGVPTKVKTAMKTLSGNRDQFVQLLEELFPDKEMSNLPVLKRIYEGLPPRG